MHSCSYGGILEMIEGGEIMPLETRHVTILLCTYNGAAFLSQQLASYLDQTHKNWSLWISDDGSSDATLEILEQFKMDHGDHHEVRILQGPCKGRAGLNFMTLLCNPELPDGLVALSDQDDIWLPEKLARALEMIPAQASAPVLYSAQSYHIDRDGNRYGQSRVPAQVPVFETAMLQNVLAGHAMVLDEAARDLVQRAGIPEDVVFHDWWLTLLLTGAGAQIVLDDHRVLLYRRHGVNVLGPPGGLRANWNRVRRLAGREYRQWVMANSVGLQAVPVVLQARNVEILDCFVGSPSHSGPARVALLRRLNLHRQSKAETLLLYVLAFLGRL